MSFINFPKPLNAPYSQLPSINERALTKCLEKKIANTKMWGPQDPEAIMDIAILDLWGTVFSKCRSYEFFIYAFFFGENRYAFEAVIELQIPWNMLDAANEILEHYGNIYNAREHLQLLKGHTPTSWEKHSLELKEVREIIEELDINVYSPGDISLEKARECKRIHHLYGRIEADLFQESEMSPERYREVREPLRKKFPKDISIPWELTSEFANIWLRVFGAEEDTKHMYRLQREWYDFEMEEEDIRAVGYARKNVEGLFIHATKTSKEELAKVTGEVCVSPLEDLDGTFRHCGFIIEGTCSYLFESDCWSFPLSNGKRCTLQGSSGSAYQEGWLVPSKSVIIAEFFQNYAGYPEWVDQFLPVGTFIRLGNVIFLTERPPHRGVPGSYSYLEPKVFIERMNKAFYGEYEAYEDMYV